MKRLILSALMGASCFAGVAHAQEQSACPQDSTAAGQALLARAEALEAGGPEWTSIHDDMIAFGNACGGDFEAQFLAADTAWELADHADAETSYELVSFILHTIRRMEYVWAQQDEAVGTDASMQALEGRRIEQAKRIEPIITFFVAPTVLRAIGEGRYFTGFDGPGETCPYQSGFLVQFEARALFDNISGLLAQNPPDTMTFPFIPGDYRLMVLEERCPSAADEIRMIRGYLLTSLAERAFENPNAPMPDGSSQPPAGLAATLIDEALNAFNAVETMQPGNEDLVGEAVALKARIEDAPERLP